MPNTPRGERRVTWASKAAVDDRTMALWERRSSRTDWAPCGTAWDAVAIRPLQRGLEALDRLQVDPASGYPVLADHLSSRLYVMVPAGTGTAAADVSDVRVLSCGHQLLVPIGGLGSPAAHWISAPRTKHPQLVLVDQLVTALQERDAADSEQAATS